MVTMDNSLLNLYRQGLISKDDTIVHSNNSELMEKKLMRL